MSSVMCPALFFLCVQHCTDHYIYISTSFNPYYNLYRWKKKVRFREVNSSNGPARKWQRHDSNSILGFWSQSSSRCATQLTVQLPWWPPRVFPSKAFECHSRCHWGCPPCMHPWPLPKSLAQFPGTLMVSWSLGPRPFLASWLLGHITGQARNASEWMPRGILSQWGTGIGR